MSFFEKYTNSKFFIICDYIFRFIVLFFCMAITLIFGLVIFSFIPSLTAFFVCMRSGKSREFPIVEGYFATFFHNFKKTCVLSIIAVLFAFLMAFNTYYFYYQIKDYNAIKIGKNEIEYELNSKDMYTLDSKKNVYLYSGKKVFIVDSEHLDLITITEGNKYSSNGLGIILNEDGYIQYYLLGTEKKLIKIEEDGSRIEMNQTSSLWANDSSYQEDNILLNLKDNIPENGYVILASTNKNYSLGEDLFKILNRFSDEEIKEMKIFNTEIIQSNKELNKTSNKIGSLICYYLCLLIDLTTVVAIMNCSLINAYFPYMTKKQTIKYSFLFVVSLPLKTLLFIVLSICSIYLMVLLPYLLMILPTLYLFIVYLIYHKDYEDLLDPEAPMGPLDAVQILSDINSKRTKKRKR